MNNSIFLEWLKVLRDKPKMILSGPDITYNMLKTYLEGYLDAYSHSLNKNLRLEITRWFEPRVNLQLSVYLPDFIPVYYKGKTDEELRTILLDLVSEYFEAHPVQ
jgi:hypothetical protein